MLKICTSWDDGCIFDNRIAMLLEKYELPGIFYIPNISKLKKEQSLSVEEIKDLSEKFEIGGHTFSHPMDLKELDEKMLHIEIGQNKKWLESIIGKEIYSFCYPRGRYNEQVIEALIDLNFKEARTTVVLNTDLPQDNFRIATTIHAYPERLEYHGRNWLELAKEQFDMAKNKDGYYHIWGHSLEVEKFGLWDDLENLFKYIVN